MSEIVDPEIRALRRDPNLISPPLSATPDENLNTLLSAGSRSVRSGKPA